VFKICPKCKGKMFLRYGSGYKGDKYEYSCMSCGYSESAGDKLPDKRIINKHDSVIQEN